MLPRLNSNKILLVCILSLVCSIAAAEDLAYLFNLALDNDPTIQAARQTELATMELIPQTRAGLLPTVTAAADTTYNHTNDPIINNYNSYDYGITLSQPVVNLVNWFQYRQAASIVKAAVATYADSMQELMLRVVTQYFAILVAIDDLYLAVSLRKSYDRSLEETKQRFNAGVIAITDVNEAQARYDLALSEEIVAIYKLHNQKEIMGEITGIPAGNISLLKTSINLYRPKPDNMEKWVSDALKQNFGLQAAMYTMESAKKNIAVQRAAHFPTVEAAASTAKTKNIGISNSPVTGIFNTVGVTVALPIYAGGSMTSKTRQAAHEYQVAVQQAEFLERQITSNVRQAYRAVLSEISQVKALQQSVISSKSALDATSAAFDVGTRTIVDVLNAQSALLRTKNALSQARYGYIVASFRLKRYAGLLQVGDVDIINSWLYPSPHLPAIDPALNSPIP